MAVAQPAASMPSDGSPERIEWWGMRATRTKAMPKHSLFGSNMENVDKEELKNTKGRYIPEGYIRPQKNRYPLPDYMQGALTGRQVVESLKSEIAKQQNIVSSIDSEMNQKAKEALLFKSSDQQPQTPKSIVSNRPNWLSENDIKHSKEINIVGLNPRGSYNRDKYGQKPKHHTYSIIGDIMAKNTDSKTARRRVLDGDQEFVKEFNAGRRSKRHNTSSIISNTENNPNDTKGTSRSLVQLPANIRHAFGSRVCDYLLSDKELVDEALAKQRTQSGPARPSKKQNIQSLQANQGNYESLGSNMRYNIFPGSFPGLTTEHNLSRTKDDFNDTVHLRRVPNPDEFRYQRDELSTWSEHNVLRERTKKAWDEAYPLGGNK